METKDKLLPVLYLLLADELTDIKDHIADSEKYEQRRNSKPGIKFRTPVKNEMQNIEWLIERILLYEDSLKVSSPCAMIFHNSVLDGINNDNNMAPDYRFSFINADKPDRETDDQNTADLLRKIHKMQAGHNDWFGMAMFN